MKTGIKTVTEIKQQQKEVKERVMIIVRENKRK